MYRKETTREKRKNKEKKKIDEKYGEKKTKI